LPHQSQADITLATATLRQRSLSAPPSILLWHGSANRAGHRPDNGSAQCPLGIFQTIEAIQRRFFEVAPYAYAGQYFPPVAYRQDRLRGVIGLAAPVYWNMEKIAA
jgi:hypothetical protein